MADTFALSAAFDKASYVSGDTMTLTVSGSVTNGSVTPVSATILVAAADGTTTTLSASAELDGTSAVTWSLSSVSDTAGRTWTINGATATATA